MSTRHITGSLWFSFLVVVAAPAMADSQSQLYAVNGQDTFRIVGRQLRSVITYIGTERLTIQHRSSLTAFSATVDYDRRTGDATEHTSGQFAATLLADGEQRDDADNDPDYLTVLNQPFSVELDAPTMHDLHLLHGSVPFDLPSPMTGAPLHGSLRRLPDGTLGGKSVLGIAFRASGPLRGSLPDHPEMALSGTITMIGTAYYSDSEALLLELDATLQIDGKVANSGDDGPVSIVYRRSIHPAGP